MVNLAIAAERDGETWQERLDRSRREAEDRHAERIAALAAAGVECFHCEDTGRVDRFPCSRCDRGRAIEAQDRRREFDKQIASIPRAIGIPPRFHGYTLDTFPDQQSRALAAVRAWVGAERDPMKPGLLLYGAFGRGKTGLLLGAIRALTEQRFVTAGEDGLPEIQMEDDGSGFAKYERLARGYYLPAFDRFAQFTTATGLLESLRPSVDQDEDALDRYRTCTYLAIDDLGAERLTEWGVDRLFEIINERHNHLRPLLVSSNLSPSELAARINRQIGDQSGDRIVERLIESCTAITFDDQAPNWRLGGGR